MLCLLTSKLYYIASLYRSANYRIALSAPSETDSRLAMPSATILYYSVQKCFSFCVWFLCLLICFIVALFELIFMYRLINRMWNVCVVSHLLHCCRTDANWKSDTLYPTCKDIALGWYCLFFVSSAECVVLFLVASYVCLSVIKDKDRITQRQVNTCSHVCDYMFRPNWRAIFRTLQFRI